MDRPAGELAAVGLVGVDRAVLGRHDQLGDVVAVEVGVARLGLAAGAQPPRVAGPQVLAVGHGGEHAAVDALQPAIAGLVGDGQPNRELVLVGVPRSRREDRAARIGRYRGARERAPHLGEIDRAEVGDRPGRVRRLDKVPLVRGGVRRRQSGAPLELVMELVSVEPGVAAARDREFAAGHRRIPVRLIYRGHVRDLRPLGRHGDCGPEVRASPAEVGVPTDL